MRDGILGFNPARLAGAGTPFQWPASTGYDRQPFANIVTGADRLTASAPNGVALGIFGWADPVSGEVANELTAGWLLGFVLPVFNMWNWQRVSPRCNPPGPTLLVLRPGLECVVAAAGDFITVFPLGAQAGQQVWTDPATGLAYGSDLGGYTPTKWTVMQNGGCNSRLRISSFTRPVTP